MKSITYKIPVGDRKPHRKKWWQIWRKKGDSAEEILADMMSYYKGEINWKQFNNGVFSFKLKLSFGSKIPILSKLILLASDSLKDNPLQGKQCKNKNALASSFVCP